MQNSQLSPVVSQHRWDMFRVPVRKVGNEYTIYVADSFTRVFDEHTLPDELKTKMAMILASPSSIVKDSEATQLMLMTTRDGEFREIGWRVSDTYFCVVLTENTLLEMRGKLHDS
jgi:hypothetical protein